MIDINKVKVKKPCNNCPFRKEGGIKLTAIRAQEIIDSLIFDKESFACHKTIYTDNPPHLHCAGALSLLASIEEDNTFMQLSQRVVGINPGEFIEEGIVESKLEFIKLHQG